MSPTNTLFCQQNRDVLNYTNDSEYFRDLIRREQDKFHNLRAAVEKGMASGVSSRTVDEIWAEAERHYQATSE